MMWYIAYALQEAIINQEQIKENVVQSLDLEKVIENHPNRVIVNNTEFLLDEKNIDFSKNVLVSLVKADNFEQYLDRSAKIYYTGKRFPSTVALNKLFYFMPYMKQKGIRDLYIIKIARVGTKHEAHPECDDKSFRLVFEIEYVGQLFDDYKLIQLDIWHTFTDTTMADLQIRVK